MEDKIQVPTVAEAKKQNINFVSHDYGQLCIQCAQDHPLTGTIEFSAWGSCYNCGRN